MARGWRGIGITGLLVGLLLVMGAAAEASGRYGIEGRFRGYDPEREIFRIEVVSRSVQGIGGSAVGGRAPDDVEPGEVMELGVSPEGPVLSRTVIKSSDGTGLAKDGTRESFRAAVRALPKDRPLALSIARNPAAARGEGEPPYRILTVIIQLTEAEIRERLEEVTQDE